MKPTKEAIGVSFITSAPNIKKKKITIAITKIDNLFVPPYSIFILLVPNNPPPPKDLVHPHKKFDTPYDIAVNFNTAFFFNVAESIYAVINDSKRPTIAN